MEEPLVDKNFLLEKYPGKGGWTFTVIPEIPPYKKARFGWVKVKGFIDDFELKQYKLMPMTGGTLFLPVRTEIRKKIGKKAGDWVHIILFEDNSPLEIPEELLLCLKDEPGAHKKFLSYTEGEQKAFIDWILSAKREETKVLRITQTIRKILEGQKFGTFMP